MKRLLALFSASLLTQVVLVLTQFILLPLQLARWGATETAAWYTALAIATLATVSDAGFRALGHNDLVAAVHDDADKAARGRFDQAWLANRVFIFVLSGAILLGAVLWTRLTGGRPYPVWQGLLILSYAAETLLIVRVMYLDSLGLYAQSEYAYLAVMVLRLLFALLGVLALGWRETGLAAVYLATSLAGLLVQEGTCRRFAMLRLRARPDGRLRWATIAQARYTVSEPFANWARLSLPVLVLDAIASPAAITAFVALRALFSAMRNVIQQIARGASVEFLRLHRAGREAYATAILRIFLCLGTLLASGFGATLLLDDFTAVRIWLHAIDLDSYRLFVAAFAISAALYPYQVLLSIMMRRGEIARMAAFQFLWMAGVVIAVALAWKTGEVTLYVSLLAAGELLIGVLFYGGAFAAPEGRAARHSLAAGLWSVAIVSAVKLGVGAGLLPTARTSILAAFATLCAVALLLAAPLAAAVVLLLRRQREERR